MARSKKQSGQRDDGINHACEAAVGLLGQTEMIQLTDAIQSLTSELHQSTMSAAENLISIPALLDGKTEQAVEELLEEMATLMAMLKEEQGNTENALQSMPSTWSIDEPRTDQ
ncbi:MAG: hypothetical protein Q9199_006968 [Rusavskia elegans]